jgi:hypothetical protein
VSQSSPRVVLAEGDITRTDHLVIELIDTGDMPQMILITWPKKPTPVRPKAYADAAAKAMRLLARANVELNRLRKNGASQ